MIDRAPVREIWPQLSLILFCFLWSLLGDRAGVNPEPTRGSLDLWTAVMTRTWSLIWDCDGIPGSFLWEWQDRAVADKCKTKLYDFDPATGVSYLKNNGLVDGWRNPRPTYYAIKMEYYPIQVGREADLCSKPGSALLSITNRYSFMDMSDLVIKRRLLRNGVSVGDGPANPKLAPLKRFLHVGHQQASQSSAREQHCV